MKLAPIILFVYNRPWHTKQTLEALMKNDYADKSVLYIYSDGAKLDASKETISLINEVRSIVYEKKWCKEVYIIERNTNLGLAQSIIQGVTEVVNKHGKIIVLEDDIVTSIGFLKYMNDSLFFYEENDKVMHISGYMYPHKKSLPETFFFNVPLCWGWATWKESWKCFNNDEIDLWTKINKRGIINSFDKFGVSHLSNQLAYNILGSLNTWFVKWHATLLLKNGFTLYPNISLVDNIGFDNTGVHNGIHEEFKNEILSKEIEVKKIEIKENLAAEEIIKNFYKSSTKKRKNSLKISVKNKIKNLFFRFFPEIKQLVLDNHKIKKYKTYVGKNSKIYPKAQLFNSIIGDYTYIAENSIINNTIIGKFCSIGPNLISGWGVHPTNGISTHPMFYSTKKQNGMTLSSEDKIQEILPNTIGNDVFIGMNVTILDGVSIGDGVIIGAGAVVSKNIPSYSIAVGNPIKIISHRFNHDKIDRLLRLRWWDFNDDDLLLIEKYFFNVDKFLNTFTDN